MSIVSRCLARACLAFALPALLGLLAHASDARACTTFSARSAEGPIVGKSFDWSTGDGWIVANERGRHRTKLVPGGAAEIASWSARFASLSFTTAGPGFPISGMNEAGLAIESLVDGAVTPAIAPDPDRLTGLELVQYALDHFDSAEGFAAFAERSGVAQLAVPLHFFACDGGGACVVVESRSGRVHVTRGVALRPRVLANRPYDADARPPAPSRLAGIFGMDREGAYSSARRFAAVAHALTREPPRDADDAFRLLDGVRIPGLTKWQIVWDLRGQSVRFRDRAGGGTSIARVEAARVACEGAPRARPIHASAGETPFTPWSEGDAAHAERSLRAQLGARSASAAQLAAVVAAATQSARCDHVE
jgi:hypothetical protein